MQDQRGEEHCQVNRNTTSQSYRGVKPLYWFNFRTVFKNETPKCNELFFPGRMAYVIDLAEEEDAPDAANAASDVPTTMIRSKADIEAAQGSGSSLNSAALPSTNDIVINKLTQILSYLRAGSRNKKKKRQAAQMAEKEAMMEEAKASAAAAAAAASSKVNKGF